MRQFIRHQGPARRDLKIPLLQLELRLNALIRLLRWSLPHLNVKGWIELQTKGTSKMAGLFLYAAMIQGAIAVVITFLGALGNEIGLLPMGVSYAIAGGSAGTWFVMGYLTYLIVGVVAMAVTSIFYNFIESVQGRPYKGAAKGLSWIHLAFGNIGVAGAALLAMWGGYWGAVAMAPTSEGGLGGTAYTAHVMALGPLEYPITGFLILAVIGFLAGGIGYLIAMRSKS